MKAERRHQLQENSLVHALEAAPFFFRKYGTQLLLGLLIVVLVFILIRNRAENAKQAQEETRKSLTNARFAIEQVSRAVPQGATADPKEALDRVARLRESAEQQLNFVFEHAEDPTVLAEARLARGDLYWQLANYPQFREAATRPTLKLDKSSNDFLEAAAKEYQNVADDPKAAPLSRTTARLSLAAVAENQGKWEDVKSRYQSVANDAGVDPAFRAEARQRLAMLDLLKVNQYVTETPATEPPIFAPMPKGTTQSSTAPTATAPASAPSSSPSPSAPFSLPGPVLPDLSPDKK